MSNTQNKRPRGPLIVIAAPSGAGKSTFLDKILSESDKLVDLVTYTTREMRVGESEGHPYHFVNQERFFELEKKGFFVEWAKVHTRFYGTPWDQLIEIWDAGKVPIMDVDVQGAEKFREYFGNTGLFVFILPPSMEELKKRLILRHGGEPEDLSVRLESAEKEMRRKGEFEVHVVNDDFDLAYAEFKKEVEAYLKRS